jgi:hypothetical protein
MIIGSAALRQRRLYSRLQLSLPPSLAQLDAKDRIQKADRTARELAVSESDGGRVVPPFDFRPSRSLCAAFQRTAILQPAEPLWPLVRGAVSNPGFDGLAAPRRTVPWSIGIAGDCAGSMWCAARSGSAGPLRSVDRDQPDSVRASSGRLKPGQVGATPQRVSQ